MILLMGWKGQNTSSQLGSGYPQDMWFPRRTILNLETLFYGTALEKYPGYLTHPPHWSEVDHTPTQISQKHLGPIFHSRKKLRNTHWTRSVFHFTRYIFSQVLKVNITETISLGFSSCQLITFWKNRGHVSAELFPKFDRDSWSRRLEVISEIFPGNSQPSKNLLFLL